MSTMTQKDYTKACLIVTPRGTSKEEKEAIKKDGEMRMKKKDIQSFIIVKEIRTLVRLIKERNEEEWLYENEEWKQKEWLSMLEALDDMED